jgi:hypothetical protein
VNADKIKSFANAARDVFALFFTPIMTVILCWLIVILAYGAWAADTQGQRINFLGFLALSLAGLVGLGGQWFQRSRVKSLQVDAPGGLGGKIETEQEEPNATVTTTTTTAVG